MTAGAEGCGLLRTELLFLERATAPTRDEQAAEYRAIGTALMDQRNLAGIGNVYRVEVLFMTRTNPWAPVGSLPEGKLTEIVTLAHKLLNLNRDRPLRSTVGHPATGRPLFWACVLSGNLFRSSL